MASGSMNLIFTALIFLALPGIIFNVLATSGLVGSGAASAPGLVCSGYPNLTCQASVNVGCQYNPASCGLQTATITVLNRQSPFTQLLSGNVLSAISGIVSPTVSQTQTVWTATGLGSQGLISGQCTWVYVGNATSGIAYVVTGCSAIGNNNTVLSPTEAPLLQPASFSMNQTSVPLTGLTIQNASEYRAGTYMQATMCTTMAVVIGPTFAYGIGDILTGCQYYHTACTGYTGTACNGQRTTYYYFVANFNETSGWATESTYGGTYTPEYCSENYGLTTAECPTFNAPATLQTENWDVFDCGTQSFPSFQGGTTYHENIAPSPYAYYKPQAIAPITPQCESVGGSITVANTTNNNLLSGLFNSVLLWFAGIFLFIMATGVGFTVGGTVLASGTQAGASVNEQGTRLAQAVGLGLIIYIPLYSEFSSWFTSGYLPYGLDGAFGIVALFISGLFWFGLFWRTLEIA